ncbi:hypothetical protein QBC34DRAFT_414800 [Podospora aff. communis PSN243]|uniref:Uncharacterized protein n=1 Tax=Podospora aff. communis PSN243 TaxID=3040156 RepID=A0AAV9G984_9PEZI|nr:hypothetical protein QBC34DRAFT_414800 [Podospora aff. communis PSN243]
MAPSTRTRKSAPASRTYRSSPAPQQLQFPARRRTIKTYGRKSTGSSARSLRQQTLTQIDYVTQNSPQDAEALLEPPRERTNKRRKTLGDTPNSSFQTQTLTQFLSEKSFDGPGNNENNPLLIRDSDDDDDDAELTEDADDVSDGGDVDFDDMDDPVAAYKSPRRAEKAVSLVPETPSHRKIRVNVDEVPSSQPTPFTPMLERYHAKPCRSPLVERSTNVDAPSPTQETLNKLPRNLVIEDTFSSSGSLPSCLEAETVEKKTPTNKPRRQPLSELPPPSQELGPESIVLGGDTPVRSGKENRKRAFLEIPDSDAESEMPTPSPIKSSTVRQTSQRSTRVTRSSRRRASLEPGPEMPDPSTGTTSEDDGPGTPTPLARKTQTVLPSQSSPSVYEETPQRPRNEPSPTRPQHVRCNIRNATQRSTQRRFRDAGTQPNYGLDNNGQSQFHSQLFESQRVPLEVIRSLGRVTEESDILISTHPDDVHLIATGWKDHEFRVYEFPPHAMRCWIFTTLPIGEVKYMAALGPPQRPGEIDSNSGMGNAAFNSGRTLYRTAHKLIQVYMLNNPVPLASMDEYGLGSNPPKRWRYVAPTTAGRLLGNLQRALFAEDDEDEEEGEDPLRLDPTRAGRIEGQPGDGADVTGVSAHHAQEEQDRLNELDGQDEHEEQEGVIIRSTHIGSTNLELQHDVIPASQSPFPPSKARPLTAGRSATRPTTAASRPEFALPALPTTDSRTSSRIRSQRQRQSQQYPTSSIIRQTNYVRPSQATTASQPSSPAVLPQKAPAERSSPQRSSLGRPAIDSSEASLPLDFGDDDGSPVRLQRGRFAMASSQAMMMDSLLVDNVGQPPEILDSDDFDDDYDDL